MSDAFRTRVRTQMVALLPRLRHSLPLPVDRRAIYDAAFDGSRLSSWMFEYRGTDRIRSIPERNLLACTNREAIVHFCLNSDAELDELTDLSDQARFWVRFPHSVGCPPYGASFFLAESMRCNRTLLDWYNQAWVLEEVVNHFTTKVYQVVSLMENPSEFALAWPEVAKAVPGIIPPSAKLRAAARSQRIGRIRDEVLRAFPRDEMERITSLLASAIMLPAAPLPDAWVGLYDIGLEV